MKTNQFKSHWTKKQVARLNQLITEGATIAYWNSDAHGRACNGGTKDFTVNPGLVQKIAGPLKLCDSGALHATKVPHAWKGHRVWMVALKGDVLGKESKLGSLEREVIGEILPEEACFDASVACRLGYKDLSGANLSGADLFMANLSRADLYESNLSRANLSRADLTGANLSGANLSGADLSKADLFMANLSRADLTGASLTGASLAVANLSRADLTGADLFMANVYMAESSTALIDPCWNIGENGIVTRV